MSKIKGSQKSTTNVYMTVLGEGLGVGQKSLIQEICC